MASYIDTRRGARRGFSQTYQSDGVTMETPARIMTDREAIIVYYTTKAGAMRSKLEQRALRIMLQFISAPIPRRWIDDIIERYSI